MLCTRMAGRKERACGSEQCARRVVRTAAMAFEKRHEPLVSRRVFARRMVKSGAVGLLLMVVALIIGTVGYRLAGDLSWIDAEYNAAMILTGMGPVTPMGSTGGKIWASA